MTATLTAENLTQPHTCPDCQHTARIEAVAALDPDRLADRVRRELRTWSGDKDDVLLYADGVLAVDVAEREVWDGLSTRTAEQQLHVALVHLAAALAAGARI